MKKTYLVALLLLLLVPLVLADTEQYITGLDGSPSATALGYSTTYNYKAQSFNISGSGQFNIQSVNFYLRKYGSPTDNVEVEIQTDNAGEPSGTLAGSGYNTSIDGSTLTTSFVQYNMSLPANSNLTGDVKYWIVFKRSSSLSTVNYYALTKNNSNADYPGQEFMNYDSGTLTWNYAGEAAGRLLSGSFWYSATTPNATPNATVTASNAYNSSAINSFTVTWNGTEYYTTTGTLTLPILTNTTSLWNITVNASDHFGNHTADVNLSSNHAATLTPYTAIRAYNAINNNSITTFNITWNNGTANTTTGVIWLPLYNGTFNIKSSAANHANNEVNVTANLYLPTVNLSLYPDPSSLTVNVYDVVTGLLINTTNTTLTVTNSSQQLSYTITDGTLYLGNLTAGSYTLRFTNINYSTSSVVVTVGVLTHQTINQYLQSIDGNVIFTTISDLTEVIISNASIQMQRIINSTWNVVESHNTDITGQAQFGYEDGINYRFVITAGDYVSKIFNLDPVLFETYTIRLTPEVTVIDKQDYAGFSIVWSPKTFTEGQVNNITFNFVSPEGYFQFYNATVSWKSNTSTATGNTATGSTLNPAIGIYNADYTDTVSVVYCVNSTQNYEQCFTGTYPIQQTSSGNFTFFNIANVDYGMGEFEKSLLGTVIVIIVAGSAALVAGGTIGFLVSLFTFGLLYFVGLFGFWQLSITLIVGFMVLSWRSSQ